LLQINDENEEQPISFFNRSLRDAELKYNILEKHKYALVNSLKEFIDYILQSKTFSYVPKNDSKDILTQLDSEGRRGKQIANM
jgi:hypothetical protein